MRSDRERTHDEFAEVINILSTSLKRNLPSGFHHILHGTYSYSYGVSSLVIRQPMVVQNNDSSILITVIVELSQGKWNVTVCGVVGCSFTLNASFNDDTYIVPVVDGFQSIIGNILAFVEEENSALQ